MLLFRDAISQIDDCVVFGFPDKHIDNEIAITIAKTDGVALEYLEFINRQSS